MIHKKSVGEGWATDWVDHGRSYLQKVTVGEKQRIKYERSQRARMCH